MNKDATKDPDEEEEKVEEKKDEGPPVVIDTRLLKIGDYELHVFLEETRGLVHPKDSSGTVDPLVKIKAFDQIKNTKTKENRGTGMTYWGEHMFFNKKIEATVEFEIEKLKIEVLDHNTIGSDALIGEFEIDLVSVYFSDKHALQHQWVALSNYRKNFEEIKGFLKFSASCVGPGDEQVALQAETIKKGDGKQMFGSGPMAQGNVLMPPQIQTKGHQLVIKLVRAENLVKMDSFVGSIDAYLTFEFGTAKFKTRIKMKDRNPVWGHYIYLPYSEPTLNDLLTIKVWDYDRGTKDEIVGSTSFSKKDIVSKKYKDYFWINFYGSQLGGDADYSKPMNSQPALGTFWKGRVLLSLESYPIDNPKLSDRMKPEPLDENLMNLLKRPDVLEWQLMAEVYYGLSFPSPEHKYSIQFRWADQELSFPEIKGKNGIWEWYKRLPLKCKFPYKSGDELPDVFIYVCEGDKRISYIRKNVHFLQNMLVGEPILMYFKPDKSKEPNMKDFDAGIVKIRCTIGPPDIFEDMSTGDWDKPLGIPKHNTGYLFANIYHAQDLIPSDNDGNSDPFYTVSYYGVEEGHEKEHIKSSLSPVWYESRKLTIPFFPPSQSPPIIVKLFDYDRIGKDFLGSAVITVQDGIKEGWISYNQTTLPEPKWVDLKYNSTTSSGRILISFNFFDAIPGKGLPSCYPEMEKYYMKIKILGLRNLKSLGLLPVKRPFIKFDINGLKARDQKQSLAEKQSVQTQPKETGSDPNLSTMISFELQLPKNYLLCPSLNCVVYDCILKGLSQPVLGVFSINISEFIRQGRERNSRKLRKASQAVLNKTLGVGGLNLFMQKKPEQIGEGANILEPSGITGPKLGGLGGIMDQTTGPKLGGLGQASEPKLGGLGQDFEPKLGGLGQTSEAVGLEGVNLEQKKEGYGALEEDKNVTIDLESKEPINISMEVLENKKERPSVFKPSGGINSEMIVIRVVYAFDKKKKTAIEQNVPNPDEYMTIGYDEKEERLIEEKLASREPSKHSLHSLSEEKEAVPQDKKIESKVSSGNTRTISNPNPKRHYRYVVNCELEKSKFMDKNTFDEFDLRRGKRIVEDSLFSKLIGADVREKVVGKFKGWIEIISHTEKTLLEKNKLSNLLPGLANKRSFSSISVDSKKKDINIDREFMEKTPVIIRVYVLQAITLAQMDDDSLSDPYLKIKLGDQVKDNVKEYQTDKTDCDFFKMFEFKSVLPGSSQLQVQVWDRDFLVKDDLIGETVIDLENRFFSRRWRKLNYVPVETRDLRHPESTVNRGRVKLWVEIIPVTYMEEIRQIWDIRPKPPSEYELRVVIWECEDVPSNDVEDCSDLYITGMVGEKQQKTDTHFRAQGGTGSFNWRMVWPITLPMEDPTINFQIWDKDYFSPNDFISECTFDFNDQMQEAWETDNSIKIYGESKVAITQKISKGLNSAIDGAIDTAAGKKVAPQGEGGSETKIVARQEEKFIINPKNCKKEGYNTLQDVGKVTISFELVPMAIAKSNKVGLGRTEPNHSPWLPPPVGRFEWSWNPITLFKRCVGPKARTKVCICLCIIICTALIINLAPIIVGDLISAGINNI